MGKSSQKKSGVVPDELYIQRAKAEKAVSWLHGFAYGASTAAALGGLVYLVTQAAG